MEVPQFIFRHEIGDAYLGAVSRFMTNAFEYGDTLLPQETNSETGKTEPQQIGHNQPYLNLATYGLVQWIRMILLTINRTVSEWSSWLMKYWNRSSRLICQRRLSSSLSQTWSCLHLVEASWKISGPTL